MREGMGRSAPADLRGFWRRLAARDATHFVADVFLRPSIGRVAGWLLLALLSLVGWLAAEFAAGAIERANMAYGTDAAGRIPEAWGRYTVCLVGLVTFLIAVEPWLTPRLTRWARERIRRWTPRQPEGLGIPRRYLATVEWLRLKAEGFSGRAVLVLGAIIAWLVNVALRLPSIGFSVIDWFLVRVVAPLAGVWAQPWPARYVWFVLVIAISAALGAMAPPAFALPAVVSGLVTVVAIVRRWNWVERDREAFMASRRSDKRIERIGFAEDLRDEALIALICLFGLVPLLLRQVDIAIDAYDVPIGASSPATIWQEYWLWLGFFGAELAKAVPLVDWSEVFHVANGSPIEARTPEGAAITFLIRATLDLLLIAAVVQAVQIAGRLREQQNAFWAGNLPILDAFAERVGLRDMRRTITAHLVAATWHPAVETFPHYLEDRLAVLVRGGGSDVGPAPGLRDREAREGALIVLAKQSIVHDAIGDAARGENEPLAHRALSLLTDLAPDDVVAPILSAVIADQSRPLPIRVAAAQACGRRGLAAQTADALGSIVSDAGAGNMLRAQAGLALAKAGDHRAADALLGLAAGLRGGERGEVLLPLLSLAYAVGLGEARQADALRATVPEDLRPFVDRATASARGAMDAWVEIPAGDFTMGSPETELDRRAWEGPQHTVRVPRFGLGTYAVTFAEYDVFCAATGWRAPRDFEWGRERRPVVDVSWHDAHAYCDWLRAWTGDAWRLPSEAEWEYACRAGRETPFHTGETITTDQANFDGNYVYGPNGKKGVYREQTVEVGSFPPNGFGLYDMHGNAWEWCQDAWNVSYAEPGRPDDGRPWLSGAANLRVRRGGSWDDDPHCLRSALRIRSIPADRDDASGFRLARTLPR